jgi:hypothetical protein
MVISTLLIHELIEVPLSIRIGLVNELIYIMRRELTRFDIIRELTNAYTNQIEISHE